ncbi:MAG: DNA-binding response regulator [Bacteroidetes bacterium]|nr:MAG: DNA-binding response regulator [Bacteroidota bacterium]
MANILFVDDHQIVIDGIKGLLEGEENFSGFFEAKNGSEAMEIISTEAIDLVLLDINLPDKSGFDICRDIKKENDQIKIIALTMHDNAGYIKKMVNAGVDGYLLKNTGKQELLTAIQQVLSGERYFSKEVTDSLLASQLQIKKPKTSDFIQKLTRREKEILRLIIEEKTTEDIAAELFISPTTVISHRKNLLRKLNAKNTAGLVRKVFEFGLLDD